MAQRHQDRKQYFKEQAYTTRKYVMPFIARAKSLGPELRILEIGCGEGGNMLPFVEMGCEVVGIDLNGAQLKRAGEYLSEMDLPSQPKLIHENIYNVSPEEVGRFDIIMMRDVIEHIPDQERFMEYLLNFIKEDGVVFFGFPPWHMPFGGHQQMCRTKLGKLPWIHLLPRGLYSGYLKAVGENEGTVASRLEIYDTGITIDRFFRIVKNLPWRMVAKQLYLFNPNYEVKFGLRPTKQLGLLGAIPYVRNLYTTCCYALISPSHEAQRQDA
jgi:SAM-dependent methyltransferase